MSASDGNSSIYLTDTPDIIRTKVTKYAFSGGGETLEEHRANGANLEVDVPFQWLTFFLDDDETIAHVAEEYGSGRMTTGEVKDKLIAVLIDIVTDFQQKRAAVTEDVVHDFMSVRPLEF